MGPIKDFKSNTLLILKHRWFKISEGQLFFGCENWWVRGTKPLFWIFKIQFLSELHKIKHKRRIMSYFMEWLLN